MEQGCWLGQLFTRTRCPYQFNLYVFFDLWSFITDHIAFFPITLEGVCFFVLILYLKAVIKNWCSFSQEFFAQENVSKIIHYKWLYNFFKLRYAFWISQISLILPVLSNSVTSKFPQNTGYYNSDKKRNWI